jgi:hypothetical protein
MGFLLQIINWLLTDFLLPVDNKYNKELSFYITTFIISTPFYIVSTIGYISYIIIMLSMY